MLSEPPLPETSLSCRSSARAMLFITAGLTGALVMVVEILGARMIGPFFGVSLFVWTALISVTLLSLAGGYAFGGRLADRHPSADWLYGLIALAGISLIMTTWLKVEVMQLALGFGLRGGTFVAAVLLFGPTLFLLGCVSPFLLRLAAADLAHLGRTAGMLYAISTAGSFLGSALTGFYLLGYVGVSNAMRMTGALLILLAVSHFLIVRRRAGLWLLLGLLPAWSVETALPEVSLSDGTLARLVAVKEGYYGAVKVVEYQAGTMRTREMIIDGLVQGGMDTADGRSVYEYAYLLSRLPVAVNPEGRSALVVGLGMGAAPNWLHQQGIATDVVEIDPIVLDMARKHFAFPASIPVVLEDARTFLARPGKPYDYILLDVFNGDTTPGYLLSREALRATKARLAPDGVLALNLIGGVSGEKAMLPAVVKTLRAVFGSVETFAAFDQQGGAATAGNFVILARDGNLSFVQPPRLAEVHPLAGAVIDIARQPAIQVDVSTAPLLTDDFNPLDLLDTHHKEAVRRGIIESTPREILLAG